MVLIRWAIWLLAGAVVAYAAYVAVYLRAKRRNPHPRLPRRWDGVVIGTEDDADRTISAPTAERSERSQRYTRIAPEGPGGSAGGVTHGLVFEAVDGPLRGQRIAVDGARYQIGAGNGNDLSIATDKYLSNLHARIEQSQGQWLIFDQGSSNGTFVDGRRLTGGEGHILRHGESVRLGMSEFRVVVAVPGESAGRTTSRPTALGGEPNLTPRPSRARIEDVEVARGNEAASVPLRLEDVQFTAYQPRVIVAGIWYRLLAFAHLGDRRTEHEPDPIMEVRRQADAILGDARTAFQTRTAGSYSPVPQEGELRLVPVAEGIEFDPPERRFRWVQSVHREEFQLRAAARGAPWTAHGRVTVFFGSVIIAEITLAFDVESDRHQPSTDVARVTGRRFRSVFPSYSHHDASVVESFEVVARALGDEYLRDVNALRTGQPWEPGVLSLIERADLFQLFWSWNAVESPSVKREYEYALALKRDFVRPVYWEDPLPQRGGLPSGLRELHFYRIPIAMSALSGGAIRSSPPPITAPEHHPPAVSSPEPNSSVRIGADAGEWRSEQDELRHEQELLARSRAGDLEARNELISAVLPALRRWARGSLPPHARAAYDEHDLVQDAVLHAVTHMESLELNKPGDLFRYFRLAVSSRIRDEIRRTGARIPGDAPEADSGLEPSPFERVTVPAADARYRAALKRLSPDERELIVGRVELALSYAELALALGKPTADAARVAFARAVRRLRDEIAAAPKNETSCRDPSAVSQVISLGRRKRQALARLAGLRVPIRRWVAAVDDPGLVTTVLVRGDRARDAWDRLTAGGTVVRYLRWRHHVSPLQNDAASQAVWSSWVLAQDDATRRELMDLTLIQVARLLRVITKLSSRSRSTHLRISHWLVLARAREDIAGVRDLLAYAVAAHELDARLADLDNCASRTPSLRLTEHREDERLRRVGSFMPLQWWAIASTPHQTS